MGANQGKPEIADKIPETPPKEKFWDFIKDEITPNDQVTDIPAEPPPAAAKAPAPESVVAPAVPELSPASVGAPVEPILSAADASEPAGLPPVAETSAGVGGVGPDECSPGGLPESPRASPRSLSVVPAVAVTVLGSPEDEPPASQSSPRFSANGQVPSSFFRSKHNTQLWALRDAEARNHFSI